MNQDNQSDQLRVVGEMFDPSNVAQPAPAEVVPNGITPDDVQLPVLDPAQEGDDE